MALPDLNIDSNLHLSIADDFRNFGQIAWNEQTPEEKIWALSAISRRLFQAEIIEQRSLSATIKHVWDWEDNAHCLFRDFGYTRLRNLASQCASHEVKVMDDNMDSVEHVAHLLALEAKSNLAKKVIDVYMDSLQGDTDSAERYWVGEFRQQPLFIHFIRTLLKSSHSYWHEYPPRRLTKLLEIHVPDLTMDQQRDHANAMNLLKYFGFPCQ